MAIVEDGFWINKRGEKVHPDMVRPDEQLKDELVEGLIGKAKEIQKELKRFKGEAFKDVEGYYDLLLQKYNMDAKGKSKKGNLTLENFSGTRKVAIAVSTFVAFDEKLSIAKEKIDEYLHKITQNSSPEIKTLITKAFEVDKKGNINVQKVLALKSYDITDSLWLEAMAIIDDATEIIGSKTYIRFYEREDNTKEWKQVSLDFAKL